MTASKVEVVVVVVIVVSVEIVVVDVTVVLLILVVIFEVAFVVVVDNELVKVVDKFEFEELETIGHVK